MSWTWLVGHSTAVFMSLQIWQIWWHQNVCTVQSLDASFLCQWLWKIYDIIIGYCHVLSLSLFLSYLCANVNFWVACCFVQKPPHGSTSSGYHVLCCLGAGYRTAWLASLLQHSNVQTVLISVYSLMFYWCTFCPSSLLLKMRPSFSIK